MILFWPMKWEREGFWVPPGFKKGHERGEKSALCSREWSCVIELLRAEAAVVQLVNRKKRKTKVRPRLSSFVEGPLRKTNHENRYGLRCVRLHVAFFFLSDVFQSHTSSPTFTPHDFLFKEWRNNS